MRISVIFQSFKVYFNNIPEGHRPMWIYTMYAVNNIPEAHRPMWIYTMYAVNNIPEGHRPM